MFFLTDNNLKRNKYFSVRGKGLRTPIYFPSISSVKTNSSPFQYFKILKALQYPHFLVSAYDVENSAQKTEFINELKMNRNNDSSIILMDSGNYESYWLNDKGWNISSFNQIIRNEVCDISFCFDDQKPNSDYKQNAEWIAKSTLLTQQDSKSATIIPIVHADKNVLIETVIELYNKTNFTMVSIPERILGDGIMERVKTVTLLRKELNKLSTYVFIHLLGTGNPLSLLLFSFAGVDSFDGLEWCQTTVNSKTAVLYHFQQRELIKDGCKFCISSDLDYYASTIGHNLNFYSEWMKRIQEAIDNNSEIAFLEEYFTTETISALTKIWD